MALTKKRLICVGAGGLAKQCFMDLPSLEYELNFVDFTRQTRDFLGYPVRDGLFQSDIECNFILLFANIKRRIDLTQMMIENGCREFRLVSQLADISLACNIELNTIILKQAVIEPSVYVGYGSILNIGSYLCHDSYVGNYCVICPRVNILGHVKIGNNCFIGTNATIHPKVEIGNNCVIGAGCTIRTNIPDSTKILNKNSI